MFYKLIDKNVIICVSSIHYIDCENNVIYFGLNDFIEVSRKDINNILLKFRK